MRVVSSGASARIIGRRWRLLVKPSFFVATCLKRHRGNSERRFSDASWRVANARSTPESSLDGNSLKPQLADRALIRHCAGLGRAALISPSAINISAYCYSHEALAEQLRKKCWCGIRAGIIRSHERADPIAGVIPPRQSSAERQKNGVMRRINQQRLSRCRSSHYRVAAQWESRQLALAGRQADACSRPRAYQSTASAIGIRQATMKRPGASLIIPTMRPSCHSPP